MGDGIVQVGFYEARHARPDSVGPDDDLGSHFDLGPVGSGDLGATDPTVGVAEQIHHGQAMDDFGAGSLGGVHEYAVHDGPSGGVQRIDPVLRLDRDLDGLVTVVERGRPDRGGPCGLQLAEHPPAMQL